MNTGQESRGRKLLATAGGQTRKPCFSLAIPPDSVVQALGCPFTLGLFFGSPLSLKLSMSLKKEEGLQGQWAQGLLLGTQVCCAQGSMGNNICWCHLAQETCHEAAQYSLPKAQGHDLWQWKNCPTPNHSHVDPTRGPATKE